MINQQLLDFIKLQLSKGIDKETITKELIGGGWTVQDIQEGFNTNITPVINPPIVNPIINPIINPVINPIVPANVNNPILTQTNKHSGKKVLLIIIALFVIAGGASGYYFRNDIPIIKDLIKSKVVVPISEIKQEEQTQTELEKTETTLPVITEKAVIPPTEIAKTTISPEKDCGVSNETPSADWEFTYKDDPALKCFGESALSCTNAKVVITGGNMFDKNPALMQIIKNNSVCSFKYTGYQKKYTQCSLSRIQEIDTKKSDLEADNPILVFMNIDKSNPEKYTASLFNFMMLMPAIGEDLYKSYGCTGDLYKIMTDSLTKARDKGIESSIKSTIASTRANAELYFDKNNGSYKNVCTNELKSLTDTIIKYSAISCYDQADSFAVSATLGSGYYCADNTGFDGAITKKITGPKCN